ncbi:hypothetical protein TI39_contig50g00012 [Zymoseptoria brevis]|uniref:DUF7071 domain-containing protein n=1 Tax=Zymoseptoria brevis TaxID=1047168 RepID=A0A0F4GYI5_9PEZI|nr:hypothetical protein TI39_contig50g00012 [Zymoseptoria brevis]
MPGPKPFTVDLKIELLELLLELAEDWADGDDPDIRNFWHIAQREFRGAKGTTWDGRHLEIKLEKEEEAWLEERENPNMKRRRGHEEGSQYDILMGKFSKIWNDFLKRHWQFMVDAGLEKYELVHDWVRPHIRPPAKPINPASNSTSSTSQFPPEDMVVVADGKSLREIVDVAIEKALSIGNEEVAENVRQVYAESLANPHLMRLLKELLTLPPSVERNKEFSAYVKELKRNPRPSQAHAAILFPKKPSAPPTWNLPANDSNRVNGKPSNFAPAPGVATQVKPPVQNAAPKKSEPVVKAAPAVKAVPPVVEKAAIRSTPANITKSASKAKSTSSPKSASKSKAPRKDKSHVKSSGDFVHTSPPADIYTPQRYLILGNLLYAPVVHQILRKAPCRSNAELELLKKILTEDPKTTTDLVALAKRLEAELRQYDKGGKDDSQAGAGASRDEASINLSKRRRESQSSSDAAKEEDRLEAQRAAKRRKVIENDRDVEWGTRRRGRNKANKNKRKDVSRSNDDDEGSDSESSDEEIEVHKSAYVDEILRKRKEEDARKVIEEQYGPVSPTEAGDGVDVEDWASMASPTLLPADLEDANEAPTCPTTRSRARNRAPIPPPPERASASNEALQLISAAAADAVARDPGIGRLEAKLDALLKNKASDPSSALKADANGRQMERTATELAASCESTLASIAEMLRNSDHESHNPELSVAILQLTQNATKSASYAAQAAESAAKMAQDVSVVLQLLASKTADEEPATPLSSKEE